MRGEVCIGVASFLSFTSLLLLIFAHVGQINTSTVPRHVNMVHVNVSNYGLALKAATGQNSAGLYTNNASTPFDEGLGLRQTYAWGLYGYCGYVDPDGLNDGQCSNSSMAFRFTPFEVLVGDAPQAASVQTRTLIPDAAKFKDSGYLSRTTAPAFWLLFLGTLLIGLALFTGIIKHKITFVVALFASIVGSVFILAGAALWSSMINQVKPINTATLRSGTPLGIIVSTGPGLSLFWAAFALSAISILPYSLSCWSYLKR